MFFTRHVASKFLRELKLVPFAGVTLMNRQAYFLLLVMAAAVNDALTGFVGETRIHIKVFVAVGSGVFVKRGVEVKVAVGVEVGAAATVCVEAAFAVCTINVLIAPGSSVGSGGAEEKVGAHAMITPRIVNQSKTFILRFNIHPSRYFPAEPWTISLFFYNDRYIWVTDLTVNRPGHYGKAFFIWCGSVKVNLILVARIHGRELNAGDIRHLRSAKIF